MNGWISNIDKFTYNKCTKLIVGNKSDLKDRREVQYEDAKKYADNLGLESFSLFIGADYFWIGITFIETSAQDSNNIDQVFLTLTKQILNAPGPVISPQKRALSSKNKRQKNFPQYKVIVLGVSSKKKINTPTYK